MKAILLTILLVLLSGCDERACNDPYPNESANANTLYTAFAFRPKHLDPAKSYSADEWDLIAQIYEPPLQYNYIDRPYVLEPLTATVTPEPFYDTKTGISTYRITLKSGIYYQMHPAFAKDGNGVHHYHNLSLEQAKSVNTVQDFKFTNTRELIAADYVNEIKRLADPKINSPIYGVMQSCIVGFAEFRDELQLIYNKNSDVKSLDLRMYDIAGVQVIDRYTYEIKVKGKYPQFKYWLALPFFAPVPWEADKFYNQEGLAEHNISLDWFPIGTGAFYLTENNPDRRLVLERNPQFHAEFFPGKPQLRLPLLDKVMFSLETESGPFWDKFIQGYYDRSGISSSDFNYAITMDAGNLALSPELVDKGIRLEVANANAIWYWGFNMLDPVVGGYTERARNLRQAINCAFNVDEYITIFANGRGIPAAGPIPPDIPGYMPAAHSHYDLAKAKQLLALAGYPEGRDPKTGQALQIFYEAMINGDPGSQARLTWVRKQFNNIGIDLIVRATDYNRFREKMKNGNAQLFHWGWNADYPDPENFLFLLYGPNGMAEYGGENTTNYNNAEFNQMYDQFKELGDDPKRMDLIDRMLQIVDHDQPWIWGYFPQEYTLYNPWYGFVMPSKLINNNVKYLSVDPNLRAQLRIKRNPAILWPIISVFGLLLILILPAYIGYTRYQRTKAQREKDV